MPGVDMSLPRSSASANLGPKAANGIGADPGDKPVATT